MRAKHNWVSEDGGERLIAQAPEHGQRGVDRKREWPASRRASVTNQGDPFPLATASADVDHQRPRDRLWGALDARPGQAAGASDAPSLPSVARAAPWVPQPPRAGDGGDGRPDVRRWRRAPE
jgi:hypothetical protein